MYKLLMFSFLLITSFSTINGQSATLVKTINPTGNSLDGDTDRGTTIVFKEVLYFLATDGVNGKEIWRSDGTTAGTYLFKEIVPGSGGIPDFCQFAILNDLLFISVRTNAHMLWKSDGTPEGTVLVKDFGVGSQTSENMVANSTHVFFGATTTALGLELWRSDGTEAGTTVVKDIASGTGDIRQLAVWNNKVYFFQNITNFADNQLFVSDGTAEGTQLVRNAEPRISGTFNSTGRIVPTPMGLFFVADNGTNGPELWLSDGTATGSNMIKNINPSTFSEGTILKNDRNYGYLNGKFYFVGYASNKVHLWVTDGTTANTLKVTPETNIVAQYLTPLGDKMYFRGDKGFFENLLWASDGTLAGTSPVSTGTPPTGFPVWDFTETIRYADKIWFVGGSGFEDELCSSDGTESGTILRADIGPGSTSGYPQKMTILGKKLMFFATTVNFPDAYQLYQFTDPDAVSALEPGVSDLPVRLLPNPATDYFTLASPESDDTITGSVKLLSPLGDLLQIWTWEHDGQRFDCTNLPAGIYFVQVSDQNSGRKSIQKLMIHK